MRLIQALITTAVVSDTAYALSVIKPRGAPRVVQHDIQRKDVADPIGRDRLRRRSGTVSAGLTNDQTLYLMNVTIGTPAQSLSLHVDTGSSDLWLNAAGSALCSSPSGGCSISGTYSANSSSTYKYINSEFSIKYADGSGASGDYVSDTVSFGGISLTGQEIGVGYTSTSPEGIIGVGYALDEAILQYTTKTYTNVPQNLVNSGYINSNAYSLWLNDLESSEGSILFGGIDTSKFTAPLSTVPIVKEYGYYSEFIIALTGLGYNGNTNSITSNQAIGVLLDSGSSLMYLPDTLTQTIYTMFGATYNSREEVATIDCSQQTNTTTLDFTFSGATIRVSLSEMVIVAGSNGREDVCVLGISPAGSDQAVLGDTFLRSAYVVYDLANNQISLAQTNFNGGSSNILEIADTVPSATIVQNALSTVAAEETGGHVNGVGGITITSTTKSGGAAVATPPPMAAAAVMGAVGAGLLAVL